ncbi:MAG: rhomboid family intramembrane serine protease [Planctomycetota bacterium]
MIPIATDQAPRRTPVVTISLIVANVLAYLAMLQAIRGSDDGASSFVFRWGLSRTAFEWWQPVTYLFVHDSASLWHLGGNMIFLWAFGSAVEGRMRHGGFLAFYLVGGMAAGLAQIYQSGAPVIGASGAVSAVTGAFIVLFPRARVSVLFLISVVPVPAMLLVALYFMMDLFGAFGAGRGNVGYMAHVTGTLFGMIVTLTLIGVGAIKRTDMDLLYLLRQWKRRRTMRAALSDGQGAVGPWASAGKDGAERVANSAVGTATPAAPPSAAALERAAKRARDDASAAFGRGDFTDACIAFERALELAPTAPEADETRLMLALIHVRKAPDKTRAARALESIGGGLPERLQPLADTLRAELIA